MVDCIQALLVPAGVCILYMILAGIRYACIPQFTRHVLQDPGPPQPFGVKIQLCRVIVLSLGACLHACVTGIPGVVCVCVCGNVIYIIYVRL